MLRQSSFGHLAVVLLGGVFSSMLALAEEQPPAPWAADSDSDESVARWAADSFTPPRAQTPAPKPVPPPSEIALAGDRYAAPAERLSKATTSRLPSDNPLRKAGSINLPLRSSAVPAVASKAEQAFNSRYQAVPTPREDRTNKQSASRRIAVGATPLMTESAAETFVESAAQPLTVEEPQADRVKIPAEAFAEPAPIREVPTPRFEPTMPLPAPIRVATVENDEPATFETDFQPAALRRERLSSAGVGRPGPTELEGPQEASLTVEKRAPAEVRIGQPARFAVRVRNTGRGRAENVVLTDQVPAGAKLISSNPTAQVEGSRLVWRLGAIEPGENRTVEMRIEPTREGPLGSVATVTMDASASVTTTCTRPELAVRMSGSGRVLIGDIHPVTLELSNPGTGAATGVMLLGDIPPAVSHPAGSALEYEVGTLEAGETRRIDLELTAEQAGRVASSFRVVGDGDLEATGAIEFEVIAPSLAVSIDGPKRRYLEREASYTIGVDNPGTAPARDVRLVTHLPRGMEFVRANNLGEYDATTHSVFWSLAELPEGERGEVKVVAMPVAAGDHTLRVQSESADGLTAEQDHRTVVQGVAALAFEVRDLSDPIAVGDETVYEIRVLNEGTKAAANVRVSVEAPAGLRIVAAEGQTGHRVAAGRAEFAPLPALQPGQKAAYQVRVTGAEPGDQRVAVLVDSDELSRPIRREESTRVFGDE